MEPSGVAIIGAKIIDWVTLKSLDKLVSLDLSKSSMSSFSMGFPRPFMKLQSLNLSETDVANIEFVRGMALNALDLSSTNITDLSPLVQCTFLHDLNLGGLNPANLTVLFRLPLQSLVVSPLLVTDKPGLNSLRGLKSLKILRAPGDRDGQSFIEFWRKVDSGEYNQSN